MQPALTTAIPARKFKLTLLGPAFIAAIGYIDPGNFATNIQAGSTFGYQLLWVVVWANLMAMLVQTLSAKLGIVTGKNLAEHIRDRLPKPAVWAYWVQAEIIAMATDLAEFIGAAVGFKLLLGVTLLEGAGITAVVTWGILMLQSRGQKPLEFVVGGLLLFVAAAYIVELVFSAPICRACWRAPSSRPAQQRCRLSGGRRARCHRDAPRHLPALGADPAHPG